MNIAGYENPFAKPPPLGWPLSVKYAHVVAADDRIRMVRKFTIEQCQQALDYPMVVYLQSTVKQAVERRLRRLQKEAA